MRRLKALITKALIRKTLITTTFIGLAGISTNSFAQENPNQSHTHTAHNVVVKGLFSGRAVLEVNGEAHLLKEGKSTPEGITLLRATSKYAQIEQNGKITKLGLNRQVGANYGATQQTELASVQLQRSEGGHFITPGRINNRWVEFMVDTGATNITLNSFTATQLGIEFQTQPVVQVETANGHTNAHKVVLSSVAVGDVLLTNVQALVIVGRFPQTLLLGNSFLSRINMNINNTAMTLQAKF